MIIVVLIVGLLASVVVVAVGGMRADAAEPPAPPIAEHSPWPSSPRREHGTGPIPADRHRHDRFERTLVDVGLLRAASSTHDIDAEGVIRAEGTSPC